MRDHRQIDERSLAFDRVTAAKIEAAPELVEIAMANLERWLKTCSPAVRPALEEWQLLLSGPREQLLATLHGTDERAARLRQSTPFAGILTTEERTEIIRQFSER
ncbi:hypothetical protein BH20VER1_BH20VER1_03790 [soil metagenome]